MFSFVLAVNRTRHMILGRQVQRVLPNWLAKPTVISDDIRFSKAALGNVGVLDQDLIRLLRENGITHLFPGSYLPPDSSWQRPEIYKRSQATKLLLRDLLSVAGRLKTPGGGGGPCAARGPLAARGPRAVGSPFLPQRLREFAVIKNL